MILSLIAAHDEQMVIGKDGGMPWHVSRDLKHFKKVTLGHTIVMGRKTFESIGNKPLPGRKNIVLSSSLSEAVDEVTIIRSIAEIHEFAGDKDHVFIIGGESLYRQTIKSASYLRMTLIPGKYDGDTFFPDYRQDIGKIWEENRREGHPDCAFIDYKRIW
jgi:dihydrofolate reductase